MISAEKIINRLQYDFDCRLTEQQILDIINSLEKRLAFDVVRKNQIRTYDVEPGKKIYSLDVDENRVTRVFVNDIEIPKRPSYVSYGYICEHGCIVFSDAFESGTIYVECLVVPEEILCEDVPNRNLFLDDGYDEVYIYHVLSREALMSGDIDMLNNYSLLYAEALNSLKSVLASAEKSSAEETGEAKEISEKYKNVW